MVWFLPNVPWGKRFNKEALADIARSENEEQPVYYTIYPGVPLRFEFHYSFRAVVRGWAKWAWPTRFGGTLGTGMIVPRTFINSCTFSQPYAPYSRPYAY